MWMHMDVNACRRIRLQQGFIAAPPQSHRGRCHECMHKPGFWHLPSCLLAPLPLELLSSCICKKNSAASGPIKGFQILNTKWKGWVKPPEFLRFLLGQW